MATAYLFYEPLQRPLSSLTLAPVTTGSYTFYYTGTTTLAPIYATNSTTGAQLANPISADGSGLFPAIYTDPTIIYRRVLKDAGGNTLEDTDPAYQSSAPPAQNQVTLASAGVVDLGTAGSNNVLITGTTTITSFGTSASLTNPIYYIRFSAPLTLTYNATTLILPGSANITTHVNDFCIAEYFGSGVWQVLAYSLANPTGSTFSSLTVGAPASGAALIVNGAAGTAATIINEVAGSPGLTLNGLPATNSQHMIMGSTTTGFGYARILNTSGNIVWGVDSSVGGSLASGTSAYASYIGSDTATSLFIGSNQVARIGINSTGNVSINAPSSGAALTVAGVTGAAAITSNPAAGYAGILVNGASAANALINLIDGQTGTRSWVVSSGYASAGTFTIRDNTAGTNPFTITGGTGNVVIAAPSSGSALYVNHLTTGNAFVVTDGTETAYITTNGAHQYRFGINGSNSLTLFTANSDRIVLSATGNVTINAPSSGAPLTVNGAAATATSAVNIQGTTTAAVWYNAANTGGGLVLGIESSTGGFLLGGSAAYAASIYSSGELNLGASSTTAIKIAATTRAVTINTPASGTALTVNAFSGTHSTKIADSANNSFNAGYLELPVNGQGTPYTAVLSDAGKALYYSATGAATFTIPANASVAYPIGTTLTFINDATGATNMTIAITTDTLVLSPAGTTGSRTLAQYGRATAHKVTATRWIISGTGLS